MGNLIERDKNTVWHPFTQWEAVPDPIPVVKGEGVYLITEDGRKIIDAISSWWVNIHGHGNKTIAAAVAEQAANLEHVIFANFTHEPAIELAENVLSILPPDQSKIFYSDNGSTSVEVALKMAFQYWYNQGIKKTKVIAIDGAYHGDTFGSMAVGARDIFVEPFAPFLFDVESIPFPTPDNEDEVLSTFRDILQSGDVASFIFEPLLQGSGGMRTYSPGILDELIAMAQSHDVICIADEVFTGFGRTGKLFASRYLQHQPDIFCLSKALTGGTLALGVTACSQKIVDAFRSQDIAKTFFHGHSFTANPIACAAANASFKLLMEKSCQDNIQRVSEQHSRFNEWLQTQATVKASRCLGTVLALEVMTPGETSYFNEIRHRVFPFFVERGILLRPLGNVLYLVPPYVIENEQLEQIYDAIREFLESV